MDAAVAYLQNFQAWLDGQVRGTEIDDIWGWAIGSVACEGSVKLVRHCYALVMSYKKLLKMTIYSELSLWKWWLSIVMLVYQRVFVWYKNKYKWWHTVVNGMLMGIYPLVMNVAVNYMEAMAPKIVRGRWFTVPKNLQNVQFALNNQKVPCLGWTSTFILAILMWTTGVWLIPK